MLAVNLPDRMTDRMEISKEKVEVELSWPQYDTLSSRQQITLFLAGQGSGKTHIAGIVSATFITTAPAVSGFIGANTYTQLSDSTLKRIRAVWAEKYGWTEYSKFNPRGNYVVDQQPPSHFVTDGHDFDTYRGKICFDTGTVVYKGSLENYKAHDGKEFGWAILDETKDTREEAVKEVILGRLRQKGLFVDPEGEITDMPSQYAEGDDPGIPTGPENTPWNPLFIFTSPAKVQWINQWFELDEYVKDITETIYSDETYFCRDIGNKRAIISSTLHNLKNLPSNFIENQQANLHSGLQDMLIYGNPFTNSGGEFYKCFDRTKLVKNLREHEVIVTGDLAKLYNVQEGTPVKIFNDPNGRCYCPHLPLHISFDFNVNPYMTCTVWQVYGKLVFQVDEICLPNPNNTTEAVCREFIRKYSGHTAGVIVYGDPSGRKEDTRTERGHNDFVIIVRALSQFTPSQRVPSVAPPVVARGNFMNTIFEKGYDGISILIHDKCKKSIDDYAYLKEASDGTKLKEKAKNPDTQVSYEKFGHTSDSGDYFICTAFANEFSKYQKGGAAPSKPSTGKKVISRNSY